MGWRASVLEIEVLPLEGLFLELAERQALDLPQEFEDDQLVLGVHPGRPQEILDEIGAAEVVLAVAADIAPGLLVSLRIFLQLIRLKLS